MHAPSVRPTAADPIKPPKNPTGLGTKLVAHTAGLQLGSTETARMLRPSHAKPAPTVQPDARTNARTPAPTPGIAAGRRGSSGAVERSERQGWHGGHATASRTHGMCWVLANGRARHWRRRMRVGVAVAAARTSTRWSGAATAAQKLNRSEDRRGWWCSPPLLSNRCRSSRAQGLRSLGPAAQRWFAELLPHDQHVVAQAEETAWNGTRCCRNAQG